MHDHEDLNLIYTGSNLDANYIKAILEDNGIGALVRDTLAESLKAGWVSGTQEDSSRVFVSEKHLEQAKKLVKEYEESTPGKIE